MQMEVYASQISDRRKKVLLASLLHTQGGNSEEHSLFTAWALEVVSALGRLSVIWIKNHHDPTLGQ